MASHTRITTQPCIVVFEELTRIVQTRPEIKVITFNSETIFTNGAIDVNFVKGFVAARNDMEFPIYIDTHRVAVNGTWCPARLPPGPGSFPAPRARSPPHASLLRAGPGSAARVRTAVRPHATDD